MLYFIGRNFLYFLIFILSSSNLGWADEGNTPKPSEPYTIEDAKDSESQTIQILGDHLYFVDSKGNFFSKAAGKIQFLMSGVKAFLTFPDYYVVLTKGNEALVQDKNAKYSYSLGEAKAIKGHLNQVFVINKNDEISLLKKLPRTPVGKYWWALRGASLKSLGVSFPNLRRVMSWGSNFIFLTDNKEVYVSSPSNTTPVLVGEVTDIVSTGDYVYAVDKTKTLLTLQRTGNPDQPYKFIGSSEPGAVLMLFQARNKDGGVRVSAFTSTGMRQYLYGNCRDSMRALRKKAAVSEP